MAKKRPKNKPNIPVGAIRSETVKSAIAKKLTSRFNSPTIYKERVMGEISKPCFFIMTVDLEQNQLMRNNYNRVYQMNVRYHAKEDDEQTYEHLTNVGTKLMSVLQYIDLPMFLGNYDELTGKPIEEILPVRGTQINFRITNDVLLFFVTYKVKLLLDTTKEPDMQVLQNNVITIKEE